MQADDSLLLLRSSRILATHIQPDLGKRRPTLGTWVPPSLPHAPQLPGRARRTTNGGGSGGDVSGIDTDQDGEVRPRRSALSGSEDVSVSSNTLDADEIVVEASRMSSISHGSGEDKVLADSDAERDASIEVLRPVGPLATQSRYSSSEFTENEASDSDSGSGSARVARRERAAGETSESEEAIGADDGAYRLPLSYLQRPREDRPVKILVIGWGQHGFMQTLLEELDRGQQSLPVSSEVMFVNQHVAADSLLRGNLGQSCTCLHVKHTRVRSREPTCQL